MSTDYTEMAKTAAGNWKSFESFGWHDKPEDAERWTICNLMHRDSGILDQSNAEVIKEKLSSFEDDADVQSFSHWGFGWVEAVVVRVYRADGSITDAFRALCDLQAAIESYPCLDEEDYSRREQEEADSVWANCYGPAERIKYIREHRSQFEFHDLADMLGCARGKYFAGYASELIN